MAVSFGVPPILICKVVIYAPFSSPAATIHYQRQVKDLNHIWVCRIGLHSEAGDED